MKSLILTFHKCRFSEDGLNQFSEMLSKFSELKTLGFTFTQCNDIPQSSWMKLSQEISKLTNLKTLNFVWRKTPIPDETFIVMSENIAKLVNLDSLTLSLRCNVHDEGVNKFSEHLQSMTDLHSLIFIIDKPGLPNDPEPLLKKAITTLNQSISKLTNLTDVTLAIGKFNPIYGLGC